VLGADMTAVLCGGCDCGCKEDKRVEEEFQMGDDVVEDLACIQCGLTVGHVIQVSNSQEALAIAVNGCESLRVSRYMCRGEEWKSIMQAIFMQVK